MLLKWMAKFRESCSCADIHGHLSDLCREFGFDHFVQIVSTPDRAGHFTSYVLCNFAGGSWDQPAALAKDEVADTWAGTWIVRRALECATPQVWSRLPDMALPLSAKSLHFNTADDALLSDGVTLGLHGRDGGKTVLSFAVRSGTLSDRDLDPILGLLHVVSPYAHARLSEAATPKDGLRPLSDRELDCLRWLIRGKTSWEIGKILGITERTAEFHVGNIVRKLECSNRSQAIAKAVLSAQTARLPEILLERVVYLNQPGFPGHAQE